MNATRRTLLGGLAAAGLVGALPSPAAARPAGGPPPFGTAAGQFTELRPARSLPAVCLVGLNGASSELTAFHGKLVLLNFWASWCAACRTELPRLDRLQGELGSSGLQVLAVSVDRETAGKVRSYLQRLQLRQVAVYADPDGRVAFSDRDNPHRAPFALYGMPITYVVDRDGRVRGYMPGEGDWASPQARRFLGHFLEGG